MVDFAGWELPVMYSSIVEEHNAVRSAAKVAREERQKVPKTQPVGPIAPVEAMAYGRVVMIFSPKGGAGCTTLATNLAVTLHNPESPVV